MSTVELRRPPSGLDDAPEVPGGSREFRRRLRGAAVRQGPVLLTYGALKLAGFAVFMYLLDSAAGLWAVWPGSGTEWSGYSESLYTALAAWACHGMGLSRRHVPPLAHRRAADLRRRALPAHRRRAGRRPHGRRAAVPAPAGGRGPASTGRRGDRTAGPLRLSRGSTTAWATSMATPSSRTAPGPTSSTGGSTRSTC